MIICSCCSSAPTEPITDTPPSGPPNGNPNQSGCQSCANWGWGTVWLYNPFGVNISSGNLNVGNNTEPTGGGGIKGNGGGSPTKPGFPIKEDRNPFSMMDSSGYFYSRFDRLNAEIKKDKFFLLPCDSNTLKVLDTAGAWGRIITRAGGFNPEKFCYDVMDSLNQLQQSTKNPLFPFDIQNIDDAVGPIVNCDQFNIRIQRLPTGFTAKSLLEYFRLNINTFIKRNPMAFIPYKEKDTLGNTIIDFTTKWNSPITAALGSVVLIKSIPKSAAIMLSNYISDLVTPSGNLSTPQTQNYFYFTTIQTPQSLWHPVSGTRSFGIYNDTRPGFTNEFTFYNSGVDRATTSLDASFMNTPLGFAAADSLWEDIQDNLADFINANGGQAAFYSQKNVKVRPKYELVREYLRSKYKDLNELRWKLECL